MLARLFRVTLLVVGFAVACRRTPAVSDVEAGPAASEPNAQAVSDHDADPGRRVWTTRPNVDACEQFRAAEAPPHSLFETRAQCQGWVGRRKCKPGSCYDGCNTVSCDATGMEGAMTLMDCFVEVHAIIEFQQASSEPVGSPPPKLGEVKRELEKALEAPRRKVFVIGHAANEEAETDAAREALREQRAEVVRGLLIAAGLPAERLFARTRASHLPHAPFPAHKRLVSFELDPIEPQRTDADTNPGDLPWCD